MSWRVFLKWIAVLMLSISIVLLVYYLARGVIGLDKVECIGENMVTTELPSPEISPLYAKPVTWIGFLVVGGWILGLETTKDRIKTWNPNLLRLLTALAGFGIFLAGYEVLFNFTLWSALVAGCRADALASGASDVMGLCNPDQFMNPYPRIESCWNIVFATKMYTALFFVAVFSFIYFLRVQRSETIL